MSIIKKFLYLLIILLALSCNKKTHDKTDERDANALIHETSPYLLQHAYNPVDWKAWNTKSLELAKSQNKLIIVSIGYSACHWCHVMEEESFQNDSIAKLMNDNFISIKVDREERPDVDMIYVNAVQLMTGSAGWPLNCITLPDGRPVFGGTYFTRKQWRQVLEEMSALYQKSPDKVEDYAKKLTEGIKNSELVTLNKESNTFSADTLKTYIKDLKQLLDYELGGSNKEPKFPTPTHLNFLLRYAHQNNDELLFTYVNNTLDRMANGGLYDQIGGGFSRYSVDKRWHIPHFEKMLYDNAQLVSVYSKAYQLTKNNYFKDIVFETLGFVDRELSANEPYFYSALDADSKTKQGELEEGAFYTWTKEELQLLLGDDFQLFSSYYNINSVGQWENDTYVLYKDKSDEEFLELHSIAQPQLKDKITQWKQLLSEARDQRHRPRTDDKTLTSWNALMLKAYTNAYRVFGEQKFLDKAIGNAKFIKENQLQSNGALYRNYKNGKTSIDGFLEDYAQVIDAYISLYQATFDEQWLNTSNTIMDYVINHFLDNQSGMFYFIPPSRTDLITNKVEIIDNVIPSSNSVIAKSLFMLGHYYSNEDYTNQAKQMLNNMIPAIQKSPLSFTNWLDLYLNYSNPYYEVAISGENAFEKLVEIDATYQPNILIAGATNDSDIPILKNRFIGDDTYIYVCVDGTCKLPVTSTEKAIVQLLR